MTDSRPHLFALYGLGDYDKSVIWLLETFTTYEEALKASFTYTCSTKIQKVYIK